MNLTCIYRTSVYSEHKVGPKEFQFRQMSLYVFLHEKSVFFQNTMYISRILSVKSTDLP